jgi:hypothetical protein
MPGDTPGAGEEDRDPVLTLRVADALRSFVPALAWLPRYDRKWLRPDVVGG